MKFRSPNLFPLILGIGCIFLLAGFAWFMTGMTTFGFVAGLVVGCVGLVCLLFNGNPLFLPVTMALGAGLAGYIAYANALGVLPMVGIILIGALVGYVIVRWGLQIVDAFFSSL